MKTSRRHFLSGCTLTAAAATPAFCLADAKPQPDAGKAEADLKPEEVARHFEKLLRAAQKKIAGMKQFTTDDMIAAGYSVQVGETDDNVALIFLLAPVRRDFLSLRWWNSGSHHSPTRLAILLATNQVDRSDTNANIYPESVNVFNEKHKRLRTMEFEISRKHFKVWNALSDDIAKRVQKLHEAGEKAEASGGTK